MSSEEIPFGELEAVFLDAGNTLVRLDFELVARELAKLGIRAEPEDLVRAEPAVRPAVSERIAAGDSTEKQGLFAFYLGGILDRALGLAQGERDAVIARLLPVLRAPGMNRRLWSVVLPGVPESLARLRECGLTLLVVSNSDGSIESGLRDAGIRDLVDGVVDSAVIGFEKPHPGIFRHALALVGSAPERTLHVGDIYAVDVVGARAAGVLALLLDPGDDWRDLDCPTLPDLPALAREVAAAR